MAQCAKYCKDIVTDELGGGSPPIPLLVRCLSPTGALTRPTMNSLCRDSSNLHNHSFSQGPWAHQSLLDLRRCHISACRPPSPLTRQRPDLVVRGVPVAHARQDWPASRTEWLACRVGWCMVGGVVGWNRMVGQGGGMLGVVRTRSVRLVIMLGDGPAMGAWVWHGTRRWAASFLTQRGGWFRYPPDTVAGWETGGVVSLTGWVRVEMWGMASVTARASAVEQAKLPPGLWCSMGS